jgi:hypothetical protein
MPRPIPRPPPVTSPTCPESSATSRQDIRALSSTIVIERRFRGPPESGNGGYTCGLLASFVNEPAEVTLRSPPPLDRPLSVVRRGRRAELFDGNRLVADAERTELEPLELPPVPSLAEAECAAAGYSGFHEHAFPTCFVCGQERAEGDGLRIFAGPVAGRSPIVAAPWTPAPNLDRSDGRVRREFVWAALDCPGAFAVGYPDRGETLLGRLAVHVESLPQVGDRYIVVGWPLGEDGRKLYAGTALFGETGDPHAWARATWIVRRSNEVNG